MDTFPDPSDLYVYVFVVFLLDDIAEDSAAAALLEPLTAKALDAIFLYCFVLSSGGSILVVKEKGHALFYLSQWSLIAF